MCQDVSGREFLVTGIVLNVGIDPVVCQRLVQVPLSVCHQHQRENLDDGLRQGSDLKNCIRRRGLTLSQFTKDFRVSEFSIFNDPDACGWNVGFLQPLGNIFLKCEIYRCGLNSLCESSRNAPEENYEKQTQWYLLCGYAVHSGSS